MRMLWCVRYVRNSSSQHLIACMLLWCAILFLSVSFFSFHIVFDLAISHPLQSSSRLCRYMDAQMEERRPSTAWRWWAGRTLQTIMRSYSKRARMKFSPKYVWTLDDDRVKCSFHRSRKKNPEFRNSWCDARNYAVERDRAHQTANVFSSLRWELIRK